jgi:arginine decarboxylase
MIKSQNRAPLFDTLKKYSQNSVTHFDVPGHKRGKGLKEFADFMGDAVMRCDVNSMKPLDNLANPIGVIQEAEELMAELFWADYAFFLVNGSTSGIQAMIMSVCNPGDKIILPRNVHRSAINGLILSDTIPAYIEPEIDQDLAVSLNISIESVEQAIMRNPDAKAILITNPTYQGFVTNLKKIVQLAHQNGIAVLVDEAHGTHFSFGNKFPVSGMDAGADMTTVSFHKTGSSLTQSSALFLNEGYIDRRRVKTILNLMQTTSASYLLMSSLDAARKNLAQNGEDEFKRVLSLTRRFREEINSIEHISSFGKELIGRDGVFNFDETKLSITVNRLGLSGLEVYDILRDEYDIQMEFGDAYNVLAVITLGDNEESLDILLKALKDISIKYKKDKIFDEHSIITHSPDVIVSPRHAFYSSKKVKKLEDCAGDISAEFIMAYPPGIPIVAPGEKISKEIIEYVIFLKEKNSMITGPEDAYADYINVLGM